MAGERPGRKDLSARDRAAELPGTVGNVAGNAGDLVRASVRAAMRASVLPLRFLPDPPRGTLAGALSASATLSSLMPRAFADGIDDAARELARGVGVNPFAGDKPTVETLRDDDQDAAVVFVHGFSQNIENTFGPFPDLVAEDPRLEEWDVFAIGYDTNLWIDVGGLWAASPPIDRLALQLATSAFSDPLDRYRSLAFVAHSMGGLVVQRALVDDQELARRIGHLICYGTPSGGLVKAALIASWKRQIRDMAAGSPFITDLRRRWNDEIGERPPFEFMVVAGDRDEFVPSRSSLEPFARTFQAVVPGNHVTVARPVGPDDLNVKVLTSFLLGEAAPAGPWNSARLAVEGRDFQRAIAELEPNADRLDPEALVTLAIAYDSTNQRDKAVALLERSAGETTDLMGTLAGRLKRRWLQERVEADAEAALDLYRKALGLAEGKDDAEQAYYHAINVAFLELAYLRDREANLETARRALDHAAKTPENLWRLATEGEAHLYLGDVDAALGYYERALDEKPDPWKIASMYNQAVQVSERLGGEATTERLRQLFRQE